MSQATKSQIDPLNRNNYTAITAMLTVGDVGRAYAFYQKAFGFQGRGLMPGPDGKPMHAELKFRESILMLGPENPAWQSATAKTLGNTPATLYLLVEDVDKLTNAGRQCGRNARPATSRHVLGRSHSHAGRSRWEQVDARHP